MTVDQMAPSGAQVRQRFFENFSTNKTGYPSLSLKRVETVLRSPEHLADQRVLALRQHFLTVERASQIQSKQRLSFMVTGGLEEMKFPHYSDLDLVLVCDEPDSEEMREFANAFFYPLWDAGLDIGHAIRRPKDFYELMLEDLTVLTAALDWRPVAGSWCSWSGVQCRFVEGARVR